VPDYRITIHMRNGAPKTGVRWQTSYDGDYVRRLVEERIKKTIGMNYVKWIDLDIVIHISGPRTETKPLL
jgi:hypothetical protein